MIPCGICGEHGGSGAGFPRSLGVSPLGVIPQLLHTLYLTNTGMGMGRVSSVGIATRYGLEGPGIESQWGARFSSPVQTGHVSHPASYTLGTGSLSRG